MALLAMAVAVCAVAGPSFGQLTEEDIEKLRQQGEIEGWTFTVDLNDATDYAMDELCGAVVPPNWKEGADFDPCQTRDDLPEAFDWRDYGGCTPIRSQGGCGSCWAFGAIGATESEILIELGVNVDLSEQWLVSCTTAGNCGGGWHDDALQFLRIDGPNLDPCGDSGAVLEADFPYVAWNAPCNCPYDHPYGIDYFAYVGDGQWDIPTPAQMKQAIYEHGPIAVCVYVNSAFQAYNGGVFNACSDQWVNHVVVLVGWDDNQGSNGVWILRNSWNTGWGEYGYMRIEYDCSRVGFAAVYTAITPPPDPGLDHRVIEVPISADAIGDDPALANARTYDLQVLVTEDDDWTSTDMTASIDGQFYQHPTYDGDVPQPAFWPDNASLEFDSFFSARDFAAPGFVIGPNVTNDSMSGVWFDVENTGNGTYTIGRFTVTAGTVLSISGTSTAHHTFGELLPFEFIIDVDIPTHCVADLNDDGQRDQADLGILLAAYGIDGEGDCDGDGDTDQADLGVLLSFYNVPCP
ncbi:MAG: hypothetical protein KAS72_15790 [Phycisphaerales bacterium]|nr:hypothetical protein [Phycisphaerales bacterium]